MLITKWLSRLWSTAFVRFLVFHIFRTRLLLNETALRYLFSEHATLKYPRLCLPPSSKHRSFVHLLSTCLEVFLRRSFWHSWVLNQHPVQNLLRLAVAYCLELLVLYSCGRLQRPSLALDSRGSRGGLMHWILRYLSPLRMGGEACWEIVSLICKVECSVKCLMAEGV
jgi:hypothetical protein